MTTCHLDHGKEGEKATETSENLKNSPQQTKESLTSQSNAGG